MLTMTAITTEVCSAHQNDRGDADEYAQLLRQMPDNVQGDTSGSVSNTGSGRPALTRIRGIPPVPPLCTAAYQRPRFCMSRVASGPLPPYFYR